VIDAEFKKLGKIRYVWFGCILQSLCLYIEIVLYLLYHHPWISGRSRNIHKIAKHMNNIITITSAKLKPEVILLKVWLGVCVFYGTFT
jgi:hypothetical protein